MKRPLLIAYQLLSGLSDTSTGLLLVFAPGLTLRWMKLHPAAGTLPFLSFIGVFVLSVGVACFYGAWLALDRAPPASLEVVWLLTAIPRGLVALFVSFQLAGGALEPGWFTVAATDGCLALLQCFGLTRGWLRHARD